MDGQLNLKDNFVQFAEENADFLKKYAEDIRAEKHLKRLHNVLRNL